MKKYVATGNDFVIICSDLCAPDADAAALSALAVRACNRHYGVGADGLICLRKTGDFAISWDFYNADGSRAAMCGNGARAAFAYARDEGWLAGAGELHTDAGVVRGWLLEGDLVRVQLSGARAIDRAHLPAGWAFLDTGVPHLVAAREWDEALAKQLREEFDANVNFVCENAGVLGIRTYERGVGETLACGTGMCAAAVAAGLGAGALAWGANGLLVGGYEAVLRPKSGEAVSVSVQGGAVYLCASARRVFSCDYSLNI